MSCNCQVHGYGLQSFSSFGETERVREKDVYHKNEIFHDIIFNFLRFKVNLFHSDTKDRLFGLEIACSSASTYNRLF